MQLLQIYKIRHICIFTFLSLCHCSGGNYAHLHGYSQSHGTPSRLSEKEKKEGRKIKGQERLIVSVFPHFLKQPQSVCMSFDLHCQLQHSVCKPLSPYPYSNGSSVNECFLLGIRDQLLFPPLNMSVTYSIQIRTYLHWWGVGNLDNLFTIVEESGGLSNDIPGSWDGLSKGIHRFAWTKNVTAIVQLKIKYII